MEMCLPVVAVIIQVFNSDGLQKLQFGTKGSGDGQFNDPLVSPLLVKCCMWSTGVLSCVRRLAHGEYLWKAVWERFRQEVLPVQHSV